MITDWSDVYHIRRLLFNHYSDEDEDMEENNSDDNGSDEEEFEYTDDEEDPHGGHGDDMLMNLENTFYNGKGLRDSDTDEALEKFESLIRMERDHLYGGNSDNGHDN